MTSKPARNPSNPSQPHSKVTPAPASRRSKSAKFGALKKRLYLELLRNGSLRGSAARKIGIHPETVRLHMRADAAFEEAVQIAEMEANEHIEAALWRKAMRGSVRAMITWLYNRDPERWHHRGSVIISGPNGGPIEVDVTWQRVRDQLESNELDPAAVLAELERILAAGEWHG